MTRPENPILAVLRSREELVVWMDGRLAPVTGLEGFRDMRRPAISATGWMAVQSITRGAGTAWQGATLLLDDQFQLVDGMPWALPTTAAAWSPDGARLARIVTDFRGETAVEVLDADSGSTARLADGPGLTALAWSSDGHLLAARRDALVGIALATGDVEKLGEWPLAARFQEFGSDDYYPTISHLSVLGQRVVAEVAWHQEGRSSKRSVYEWRKHGPSRVGRLDGFSQPTVTPGGIILTSPAGEVVMATVSDGGVETSLVVGLESAPVAEAAGVATIDA